MAGQDLLTVPAAGLGAVGMKEELPALPTAKTFWIASAKSRVSSVVKPSLEK